MIQFGNDKIKEIYHGSDTIRAVYYGGELVWLKPSYMILTDGTRIIFDIENTPIASLCTPSSSIVINGSSYTKTTIKEIHFGARYSGVTEIGENFLRYCTSLTNITLDFPVLNSVGGGFLGDSSSLTNLTLDFPMLNSVGAFFLLNCSSLTNPTLDFPMLTKVGPYFLARCTSLTNITLDFPVLNSVGYYFLDNCTSLTNITLDFPVLNSVDTAFLYNCRSLTEITLTAKYPPTVNDLDFLYNVGWLTSIYVPADSVNRYKTTLPWSLKDWITKAI